MECSFRTLCQWQHLSKLLQIIVFHWNQLYDSPVKYINEVLDDLKNIHKNTQHSLALCYKVSKVNITEVVGVPSIIEILPIVLEINKETFLLAIVRHAPSPVGSFIDDFFLLMDELPIQLMILIVGDFNLDQMLPKNVANIAPLIQNLSPRSQYSAHIHEGILDLVFDSSSSNIVSVLHSTYSYQLVLVFQIWGQDMVYICTVSITHITLLIIIIMVILSVSLK